MALTFGREKLKGTSKTQGDFNLQNRCYIDAEPKKGQHLILRDVLSIEGIDGSDPQTLGDVRQAIRSVRSGENLRPNPKVTLTTAFTNEANHFYYRLGQNKVLYASSVIFQDDAGTEVGRMVLSDAVVTGERKYTPAAQSETHWHLEINFTFQKATVLI